MPKVESSQTNQTISLPKAWATPTIAALLGIVLGGGGGTFLDSSDLEHHKEVSDIQMKVIEDKLVEINIQLATIKIIENKLAEITFQLAEIKKALGS